MIIKTKRVTSTNSNGENSGVEVKTKESKKPGETIKETVVNSYKNKVKPVIKNAVSEAGKDLKGLIQNK